MQRAIEVRQDKSHGRQKETVGTEFQNRFEMVKFL
jgi:hypothetical protein